MRCRTVEDDEQGNGTGGLDRRGKWAARDLGCAARLLGCYCFCPFFYFFKQNKRAKSTEEFERVVRDMRISLESIICADLE